MAEGQTLQGLIQAKKGRRTYEQLAAEAGNTPGTSRWQQFGIGAIKASPDPAAIVGIAQALHVPVSTVWDAIGRSLGLDLTRQESSLIARMSAGTDRIPEPMVEYLLGIIDEYLHVVGQVEEVTGAKTNVRRLKAARKTTGHESRGPRGGVRPS